MNQEEMTKELRKIIAEETTESIKELIRIQQRPKIHVGVEEKIPTVQYGNKTYTYNVSFYADKVTSEELTGAIEKVVKAIDKQKQSDGLGDKPQVSKTPTPQKKELTIKEKRLVDETTKNGFKTTTTEYDMEEKTMLDGVYGKAEKKAKENK